MGGGHWLLDPGTTSNGEGEAIIGETKHHVSEDVSLLKLRAISLGS